MSATRFLQEGPFTSISVADTGGGTAGVDFTLTAVVRSTGVSHSLAVTSATTPAPPTVGVPYYSFVPATPSGVSFFLSLRSPAAFSDPLSEVVVQTTLADTSDVDADADESTPTIRLLRVGGDYVWQSAPVIDPGVNPERQVVLASGTQSANVSVTYSGGTSAPASNQAYWGVRFAAGTTPPGTSIHTTSFLSEVSGNVQVGFYGRNTVALSTAVNLINMTGSSGNNAPQLGSVVVINTNTIRSSWIDHTNSGGTGSASNPNATDANLNTDEEWEMFMVRAGGTGTHFGNGLRVMVLPPSSTEGFAKVVL